MILDVKHFEIHDGDGIRTTLFFKGCMLHCKWCHNPESLSIKPEIMLYRRNCINCCECAHICSLHSIADNIHTINREKCIGCGMCAKRCPTGALKLCGRNYDSSVLNELLEDKRFYINGGGVTLSGGEPLMQPALCQRILNELKSNGIRTAVDTCGCVPQSVFELIMPYTDDFLYDIKAIDEKIHINCTGVSNKLILDNLLYLDNIGAAIEIRIPYVPGMNDSQIPKIGEFLKPLKNIKRVRVLAYHNYAEEKYKSLDIPFADNTPIPGSYDIEYTIQTLREYGLNAIGTNDI